MKCAFGILERGSKNSGRMTILYERNSSNTDPKISKIAILILQGVGGWVHSHLLDRLSCGGKDDLRVREDIDVGCTYLTHMIAKRGKVT